MKVNLRTIIGILGGVVMASCSTTTDEPDTSQTPIQFGAVVSRAVVTSSDDMSSFAVWGGYEDVYSFENTTVSKGESGWTYGGGNRYWVHGKTFNFYAVYPATLNPKFNEGNPGYFTIDNYILNHTIAEGLPEDLMMSVALDLTAEKDGQSPIPLQFKHLLTQIDFVIKADPETQNEIGKVTVKSAKLYGTHMEGSYSGVGFDSSNSQKNGTWTAIGDATTEASPAASMTDLKLDIKGKSLFGRSLLVFPLLNEEAAIMTLTYTVGDEEKEYSLSYNLSRLTPGGWQAGKSYRYSITIIDKDHILFDVPSVIPWTNGSGGIIIVE